jgi:hypothetical protein
LGETLGNGCAGGRRNPHQSDAGDHRRNAVAHGHGHAVIVAVAFAFMQHGLNGLGLRGFDRIQIECADVPPQVEHAIESVRPVRSMRLDERLELVLGTGIDGVEIA